ncbi:hypothetical protein GCM10010247_31110 [Streptomyces calvus]|nr:hypothetical protein GCM10010247_31110 [Streptomyces calvus]
MGVAQVKARTAEDLPDPPRAMTLAERRKQVAKDRRELSPVGRYMTAPERTAKGTPHGRPDRSASSVAPPPRRARPRSASPPRPGTRFGVGLGDRVPRHAVDRRTGVWSGRGATRVQ